MNTESAIKMYHEHLTPTFRNRRQDLDLVGHRGGIIFDAFTGNEGRCKGEDVRRDVWSEEANVAILPKIPGKGSVKQQPCDRVHGVWRKITDYAEDSCIGMRDDVFKRSPLADILMGDYGPAKHNSLTFEAIADINLWAWEGMPVKLGRWAWIATGYISVSQMAGFWDLWGA